MTELHGGQLLIESAKGRGTTIRIALPAERVVQPAVEEPAHQLHLSLG